MMRLAKMGIRDKEGKGSMRQTSFPSERARL